MEFYNNFIKMFTKNIVRKIYKTVELALTNTFILIYPTEYNKKPD